MEPTIKRYPMPKGCKAATVDVRELKGKDELTAAQAADAMGAANGGARALVDAERREAVRLSIVRIDNRPVNGAEPLMEIDGWSPRARAALGRYFDDMNGVDGLDVAKALAEPVTDGKGKFGRRYTMPPGCNMPVVTFWEIGGHEELVAAMASRDDGKRKRGPAESILLHRRALMAASMRDQPATWDDWSMRTASALAVLYHDVNGIPEDEIEGCVAAGADVGAPTAEPTSPPPVASPGDGADTGK